MIVDAVEKRFVVAETDARVSRTSTARRRREVLYETDRTRVTRDTSDHRAGRTIRKEMLGPGAVDRARHELRMLDRVAGLPGVLHLAAGRGADELLFDEATGITLAALIRDHDPDVGACLDFAVELSRIVAAVHRSGVVHRDINPANVMVVGPQREPLLIDFDLASTFSDERPGFTHHRQIVGTLPYLAPEQTGRTGMPVDERADLYALGATLYELVTGQPPFPVGDPLDMIHHALTMAPVPPVKRNPLIPTQFSDILLRLLEKEPDRRYQSAEGLTYDLTRLRDEVTAGRTTDFVLGRRDFPRRLSAPSALVGRDVEIAALRTAFDTAVAGGRRGILVAGSPGVGKSVLVNGLRSVVTEANGWFVAGKSDQYRQDTGSNAITEILRALARLLLAGTEPEIASIRQRIEAAIGANMYLLTDTVPEFGALLAAPAEPEPRQAAAGDISTRAVRQQQAVLDLLGAVASSRRPLVIFLDDLQWADPVAVGVVDAVLTDDRLAGVLLVGAYRDAEVDATHPLTAGLSRWQRLGVAPSVLRLQNLPPSDLAQLLAEMLRLPTDQAIRLADVIGTRSAGNPFDTVEFVNALRRDGALAPGPAGWTWDAATIRRFVGQGDVVDLLAARIDQLPRPCRQLMEIMGCLGGQLEIDVLRAACAVTAETLTEMLVPALEDGLLVLADADPPTVRFRHDRVQQAAHGRLIADARLRPLVLRDVHLSIARRLAIAGYQSIAAEQYLNTLDALDDPDERRNAARLFVAAAAAVGILNPSSADRFLTAAAALLSTGDPSDPLLTAAQRERHVVLYRLGRLAEADPIYDRIAGRCTTPADLADLVESTCIQIASLANRDQHRAAVDLGLALLQNLGVDVPTDFAAEVDRRYDDVANWAATLVLADDLARPEPTNPQIRLAAEVVHALMTPSLFCDPAINSWLFVTSQHQWVLAGPSATVATNVSAAPISTILLREDYRTGYAVIRHALAVSEARGYDPQTSWIRQALWGYAGHWFEPLEGGIAQSQLAREGLIRGGDLQYACYTYGISMVALVESSPTLDGGVADLASATEFAARTNNAPAAGNLVAFRQLFRALRGETNFPGSFDNRASDEGEQLVGLAGNPMGAAYFHIYRAVAAAIFNDEPNLVRHAAAAMPLLPYIPGFYPTALAQLMQGLALAGRIRTTPAERPALLPELDSTLDWMAARAADAPGNFGHLHTLLTAERAWAIGDDEPAARAFDTARRQAATCRRPWHEALITERSAMFHFADGFRQTGLEQLAAARRHYAAWGATGKVAQLDHDHPSIRLAAGHPAAHTAGPSVAPASSSISTDDIDMLAILRASQALSSQTSLRRLRISVGEVLRSMTGAATVLIALRDADSAGWLIWNTTASATDAVPLAQAAELLPLSAFHYAERTGEPLLLADAGHDDRFARDPYLAGLDRCSLLVMPIHRQGKPHAMLILENRDRRGAFAVAGLDAVTLITGQLTVSLDNAQLYASLEHKVAQRTAALAEQTIALEQANRKLEALSNTDALTGLPNRRHFDTTVDAEWRRAVRQHNPLGLAMIDIDHFKSYNDRYGHPAGDSCLRLIARALTVGARSDLDVICRYGGEEFVAVLPGADESTSLQIAERIRTAVADLRHPHPENDTGVVSVSIGVACYLPGTSTTVTELIQVADQALYQAKNRGRNQVRPGRQGIASRSS